MADVAEHAPFTDPAAAISQGKRHLLVRDYTAAVTAFAEGLELLSQKHGDCGDELGEPYLLYGRALLGLAREEAGVLGGGVPGGDEEEDDEEDDEIDEEKLSNVDEKEENEEVDAQNKDTSTAEKIESSSGIKETTESTKPDEMNKTDDDKIAQEKVDNTEKEKNVKTSKVIDNEPGTSKDGAKENGECSGEKNANSVENGEDTNKEEDDEDPGRGIDLQVAWEVLELAKIVFFKRGSSGYKQLAEAYRLLGEVAMESGNHQVAVSDLEQALKILQNVEPCEPRAMAELHYQLGLAHSLGNDFDASIEQFNEATNLLEARIKELENTKEPPKTDDPFYTIEGEINELKELLPEIQDKIADMKDFKQEACRLVIEGIKSKVAGGCTNGAGPSNDGASSSGTSSSPKVTKPASDISHLVRKKRKNEDTEPQSSASPCKKPTP